MAVCLLLRRQPLFMVAAALTLTLTACGEAPRIASAHPLQPSGAHYLGPILQIEDFTQLGILLEPPGPASPKLSWQSAYAHCVTQGCITYGNDTEVVLARATTTASGTTGPDGTIIPGTDKALDYVLLARNAQCPMPAGQTWVPGKGTTPPNSTPARNCTFIQLLDANTGAVGYAASGSGE
jgi:hypothetical protein